MIETETTSAWFMELEKKAKQHGVLVHLLGKVPVNYKRPVVEAAISATRSEKSFNAALLKHKYPFPHYEQRDEIFVLAKFDWKKDANLHGYSVAWGRNQELHCTIPHGLFAAAEYFPDLYKHFRNEKIRLVETSGFTADWTDHVCVVLQQHKSSAVEILKREELDRKPGEIGSNDLYLFIKKIYY